jgi:branched-chain amino acid transport system permease protein
MSNRRATAATAFVAAAILFPGIVRAESVRASVTQGILFVVAAMGLNVAAGFAGMPSLAQAAFAGLGAYAAAILRVHAGWGPVPSIVAAIAIAAAAGLAVARAVARLRPAFVALATWIVAWTFAIAIERFPGLSGGASGIVVPPLRVNLRALGIAFTMNSAALYEVALAVALATWFGVARCERRYGPALLAIREDPSAASSAGIDVARMRAGALTASAAIAGVAGALGVHVAGVADPAAYLPLRSVELFVVVLAGGATLAGPAAGSLLLFALSRAGGWIAARTGHAQSQIESIGTGALLLLFAVFSPRAHRARLLPSGGAQPDERGAQTDAAPGGTQPARTAGSEADPESGGRAPALRVRGGARLVVEHATVDFAAVRALDDLSVSVEAGTCHAIIGPNGSGKTTLLRVMSGALRPDGARVTLDGEPVGHLRPHERAAAGIARTFQRPAVSPAPTALQHAMSGMESRRGGGFVRTLLATPGARAEERDAARDAADLLEATGLGAHASMRAGDIDVAERRFVQIARALASQPRVLILDEPSAGLVPRAEVRLLALLRRACDEGLTVVLVEHHLPLVRAIADRVTVLDAGARIAEGTPAEIAADPAVQAAYLG